MKYIAIILTVTVAIFGLCTFTKRTDINEGNLKYRTGYAIYGIMIPFGVSNGYPEDGQWLVDNKILWPEKEWTSVGYDGVIVGDKKWAAYKPERSAVIYWFKQYYLETHDDEIISRLRLAKSQEEIMKIFEYDKFSKWHDIQSR